MAAGGSCSYCRCHRITQQGLEMLMRAVHRRVLLLRPLRTVLSSTLPAPRTLMDSADIHFDARAWTQLGGGLLVVLISAFFTGHMFVTYNNRHDVEMAKVKEAMVGLVKEVDAKLAGIKCEVADSKVSMTKELDAKLAGISGKVDAKLAGIYGELDAELAGARVAAEAEALRVLKDYGVRVWCCLCGWRPPFFPVAGDFLLT